MDHNYPGLLSNKQRKYLVGDFEPANERTMRLRIRRRIQGGLRDFRYIYQYQPQDELNLVFKPSDYYEFIDKWIGSDYSIYPTEIIPKKTVEDDLLHGIQDTISYFYCGIQTRGLEEEHFEEALRNGIKQAIEDSSDEDIIAEIDLSINTKVSDTRLSELKDAYLSEEKLSVDELSAILDSDPGFFADVMTSSEAEGETSEDI